MNIIMIPITTTCMSAVTFVTIEETSKIINTIIVVFRIGIVNTDILVATSTVITTIW